MAYTPNTLYKMWEIPNVRTVWLYLSADASTAVDAGGYIADAAVRGVKAGDILIHQKTDTFATTLMYFNSASDLVDGTAITSTDSD